MWCFSDDRGVHPASAKRLKMEVFPGDSFSDDDVQKLVDELIAAGLVREFTAEGKAYWAVTGWHHQKIVRPNPKYPAPPSPEGFDEHSATNYPRKGCRGDVDTDVEANTPYPPRGGGDVPKKPGKTGKPSATQQLSKSGLRDSRSAGDCAPPDLHPLDGSPVCV